MTDTPKPVRVSPSQLKVWRRCQRKWAFKYINRLKEPTTAKQQFGTDVHTHMEDWIQFGKKPPDTETGNVADQLIRKDFIPEPSPALVDWVEKMVNIDLGHIYPGTSMTGRSDLIVPPTLLDPPEVVDYKTTSSLRWAMTQEQAKTDPQALVYGKYAMAEFNTDQAIAKFLYAVATNPKTGWRKPGGSKKVSVHFHRDGELFQAGWHQIECEVAGIVEARHNWTDANKDASYNMEACNDFNGCPFADICQIPKGKRLSSAIMKANISQNDGRKELSHCGDYDTFVVPGENNMSLSLLDKIRATKKANGVAQPIASEAVVSPMVKEAAPVAEASAATGASSNFMERLKNMNSQQGVNPPAIEGAPEVTPQLVEAIQGVDALKDLTAMSIKDLKNLAKQIGLKKVSTLSKSALAIRLEQEGAKAEDLLLETETAVPVETETVVPVETETAVPDVSTVNLDPVPADEPAGLMVLFDCALFKGRADDIKNLSDWIAPMAELVAQNNDVLHWNLMEYGKGPASLAYAVDEALKKRPQAGCILVDSHTAEGRALKDTLIRHATIVIQGVR